MAKKTLEAYRSRVAKPLQGERPKTAKKIEVSKSIFIALSIVSILGFIEIITQSFFNYDIALYVEALLMIIVGIALILEAQITKLYTLKYGITPENFTRLITATIGTVAILAGIFSIPGIRFEGPVFLAMKGILAILAIVIIIIQTWVVE